MGLFIIKSVPPKYIYINSSFVHQNLLVLYVIQVLIFLGRHTNNWPDACPANKILHI